MARQPTTYSKSPLETEVEISEDRIDSIEDFSLHRFPRNLFVGIYNQKPVVEKTKNWTLTGIISYFLSAVLVNLVDLCFLDLSFKYKLQSDITINNGLLKPQFIAQILVCLPNGQNTLQFFNKPVCCLTSRQPPSRIPGYYEFPLHFLIAKSCYYRLLGLGHL